jgi:RNA methyltransferase, TrmH family
MVLITSPSNPRISKLQTLQTARGRKKSGFFLMEGPHLLEGLLDAHLMPHEVYYQPELLQRTASGRVLLERLLHAEGLSAQQCVEVSERVIEAVSDTQSSQGVVSVLPLDAFTPDKIGARRAVSKRPALLILDDVADPGNMGTILRTALAADVDLVLLTPDCVDWFSPKVVRAAAGAHLALPVESDVSWENIGQRVTQHAPERVFLAEAGDDLYYKEDLRQPFALIIGNEAHGPSAAARKLATKTVSIPLYNGVESLNAAMAAGIILYEAVRQRTDA